MEAVVKVTNYNRPPKPPVSPNQSGMFSQAQPNEKRETHEESRQRTEAKVCCTRSSFGLLYLSTPQSPSPPTLLPTPSYYTTSSPAGLATENEEKRRGGFRAVLFPLSLLNFSANISAVQHIQSPKWKRMREAVGAPLLSVWLPLLFTLDLRRGLCRLWDHMLLRHTQSLSHTHIHKHILALSHLWNCRPSVALS